MFSRTFLCFKCFFLPIEGVREGMVHKSNLNTLVSGYKRDYRTTCILRVALKFAVLSNTYMT